MQNKPLSVFIILLLFIAIPAKGQKLINSPYSRFNIGTIEPSESFRSLGMGGIGISMRDNSSVYFSNPASYSSLDTISFVFDFGMDYGVNYLTEGEAKYSSDDFNFNHLIMGFPLSKGWGFAAGIVPYSNGYYKIAEAVMVGDPGYDPLTGEFVSSHIGEGGFTKIFAGSGIKVTENLSAGINMTLIMGQIKRTNQFDFGDYYNSFNNSNSEKLQIRGINFDYGVHYTKFFSNNYFLTAGISTTFKKQYKSKYENLTLKYTAYGTQDTLSYTADDEIMTTLPNALNLGLSFGKKDKFVAGFDFISTQWSNSSIPGSDGYAANTKKFRLGAEYIPDRFSNYNLLKRMEYRIGGHFGDNYLIINGDQLKEYGVTAGLGFPMRRTWSKTNLFFDFTRRIGSASANNHTEDFIRIGISLNLYDNWFVKRKYD